MSPARGVAGAADRPGGAVAADRPGAAEAAARIERERAIAIVRLSAPGGALDAARAVVAGGLTVVEISLTTPDALATIEQLTGPRAAVGALATPRSRTDERDADGAAPLVGAGTVRSVADAERAVAAGAAFLLSPHLALDVLAWAQARDLLAIPGAFTPTDVAAALDAGAPLVKLFPAGVLGPGYVRDLLGPFPAARLVPTGGVGLEDAGTYLDAGAAAVALGGALVGDRSARDPDRLQLLARTTRARIPSTPPR